MSDVQNKPSALPLPPLIYIAAIAISIIAHYAYPLPWLSSPLSDILFAAGWLVLLAVAALLFTAIRTMTRAKTTLNPNATPDHLVTSGPFSITRNPMYLANTLLMIGVGLISGITWFLPLAVIAAFVTQKVAIEREERVLTEKFGKRYRDYAKRVRRWI
jgi:protein-S-isoprenylcysteine O-methyltransferase Ste14